MTTLTSRKAVREKLGELLDAITNLVAYDHEPKDLRGKSPVLTVHSDGTRAEFGEADREFHRFWVTTYWLRDDPATTEDNIDDLAQAVRQKLIDNHELANFWEEVAFEAEFSETTYVVLDGKQYRSERMRVIIQALCN